MNASSAELPNTSLCPRCGAGLRCAMVAGDAECWCVQLPQVMPVPSSTPLPLQPEGSAASCFCPACLQQIINEQSNAIQASRD
jgi:predicted RNA-binding Zn-ribbon protein involved in translation (DUF1610 family)